MQAPSLSHILQRARPKSPYVDALLRWLWLIVVCAVLAGGVAYVASKLQHPVYRASALLVVDESHSGQDLYNSYLASEQFATLYTQLVKQPIVLEQAAHELGGVSVEELASAISTASVTGSPSLEVRADSPDPTQAARMANGVAEALVAVVAEQGPGNTNIVRVFQPAVEPSAPDHPRALRNAAIGAALGLALAVIFVLLMEALRERVRTPEQIEQTTGLTTIGAIPDLSTSDLLAAWRDDVHLRERFRMLRTNLYTHPDHTVRKRACRVVAITSAEPEEGKTLIATELAIALAQSGKRVLLIDGDLHHPSVHERLGLPLSPGLIGYLEGEDPVPHLETLAEVPDLWVLPAGVATDHATEMLGSKRMRLLLGPPADGSDTTNPPPRLEDADVIVLDTPPLLAFADAAILSAEADEVLVVADTIRSRMSALIDAREVLQRVGARVIGVVLNRTGDLGTREYYRVGARNLTDISAAEGREPEPV
jgi:capsular exopolysaccharide synthesis family protein